MQNTAVPEGSRKEKGGFPEGVPEGFFSVDFFFDILIVCPKAAQSNPGQPKWRGQKTLKRDTLAPGSFPEGFLEAKPQKNSKSEPGPIWRVRAVSATSLFRPQKGRKPQHLSKHRSPGRSPEGKGGFPGRSSGRVIMLARRCNNKKQSSYIYIYIYICTHW